MRELAVSFEAAREVLDFQRRVWSKVTALDGGKAPARRARPRCSASSPMCCPADQTYYWLARACAGKDNQGVDALIDAYRRPADALKPLFPQVLYSPFEQKAAVRRAAGWIRAGAPKEIAHQVALYRPLSIAAVLADLAREQQLATVAAAARLYHQIGEVAFAFDRLRAAAGSRTSGDAY